jgi:Ubiquitin carboxyl-terminal hydrolase
MPSQPNKSGQRRYSSNQHQRNSDHQRQQTHTHKHNKRKQKNRRKSAAASSSLPTPSSSSSRRASDGVVSTASLQVLFGQTAELLPRRIEFVAARTPDQQYQQLRDRFEPINKGFQPPAATGQSAQRPGDKAHSHSHSHSDTELFPSAQLPQLCWQKVHKIGAGLRNMGNTCYLNATLQCLSYVPVLGNFALQKLHSSQCTCVVVLLVGVACMCRARSLVVRACCMYSSYWFSFASRFCSHMSSGACCFSPELSYSSHVLSNSLLLPLLALPYWRLSRSYR